MYNLNQLLTLVRVAELGSFNKVAEKDYLSPNTVMRQISAIEEELGGIRLFERNNKGSKLTEAGKLLYDDARAILADCDESKRRIMKKCHSGCAVRLMATYDSEFDDFEELWKLVHEKEPSLRLDLVPIIYNRKVNKSIWSNFDDWTDIRITHMSKHGYLESDGLKYDGIGLGKAHLKCAMSSNHRLTKCKELKFEDLIGEEVMILKHTWSDVHAAVLEEIRTRCPEINLNILNYFSANDYNDCANGDSVILAFSNLTKAHPFITMVPMDEKFDTSVGLTYLTPPAPHVERFMGIVKEILDEHGPINI